MHSVEILLGIMTVGVVLVSIMIVNRLSDIQATNAKTVLLLVRELRARPFVVIDRKKKVTTVDARLPVDFAPTAEEEIEDATQTSYDARNSYRGVPG